MIVNSSVLWWVLVLFVLPKRLIAVSFDEIGEDVQGRLFMIDVVLYIFSHIAMFLRRRASHHTERCKLYKIEEDSRSVTIAKHLVSECLPFVSDSRLLLARQTKAINDSSI